MMKFSAVFVFALLVAEASPAVSLRSGDAVVFERADRSAIVITTSDNPVLRFTEEGGASAVVRATPIDSSGGEVGSGQVFAIRANEKRDIRLRDAFTAETLANRQLRIEVLGGDGRVAISTSDDFGPGLQPDPNSSTSRRRAVSPGRPTQPSSRSLIEKAEAAGTISSETALLYRVYALFDDARLPQQFRGDDALVTEASYLMEVRDRFPTLSAATQAAVQPFLTPPAYKGSWSSHSAPIHALDDTVPPACQDGVAVGWGWVDTANARARIWFNDNAGDGPNARTLADTFDSQIWPKLSALMPAHLPLPDFGMPCDGGSGKLDIYLTDVRRSFTIAFSGCSHQPAFIVLNRSASDQVAVHEIFHAFQYAHAMSGCIKDANYGWWTESSAQWAEDFVYPTPNEEQVAAYGFQSQPEESLDFQNDVHEYGAYLLPFYVHRQSGDPAFVRVAWENCAKEPALEALDHAIDGGFEKVWPEFAVTDSNHKPYDDFFKWDKVLSEAVLARKRAIVAELQGSMDKADPLDFDLPRLSAIYYHYVFSDPAVRTVAFWNGVTFNIQLHEVPLAGTLYEPKSATDEQKKGAHVEALIKIGDNWTRENWTNRAFVPFCRDMAAERIEELILVISNSEFKDRQHRLRAPGENPLLWTSNMGCWKWKGKTTYKNTLGDMSVSVKTDVTWTREPQGDSSAVNYDAEGTETWSVSGGGCSGGSTVPIAGFGLLMSYNFIPSQGSFHRSYIGTGADTRQYTINCDKATPMFSPGTWLQNPFQPPIAPGYPGARFLNVSADGTVMDGAYTIPESPMSWTWHFEAQREP